MAEAARYLLAHPQDVAVHSMRTLARRAEVPPVTLVRLAQRLGLPGYNDLRQTFVERVLRHGAAAQVAVTRNEQSARAIAAAAQAGTGALAFAESFLAAEHDVLRRAFAGLTEAALDQAATVLAGAPRVFVAARRTSFPAAFTLAYALRKARPGVVLLDDAGGAPEGPLEDAQAGDAFVAFTFAPFSRVTDTLARRAATAGGRLIVVTDIDAAPLRELAGDLFFVAPTLSRAFPESALGALTLANLLAALAVAKLGGEAQKRIRLNERRLVDAGEYLLAGRPTRRSRATVNGRRG
ncbi:MurR/RpiR family transcriptional regulator [Sabulicella glaciei]|nr:MurR/RpiR family transcriptional regulator [Roseococcus sp. MDT2-1-1]